MVSRCHVSTTNTGITWSTDLLRGVHYNFQLFWPERISVLRSSGGLDVVSPTNHLVIKTTLVLRPLLLTPKGGLYIKVRLYPCVMRATFWMVKICCRGIGLAAHHSAPNSYNPTLKHSPFHATFVTIPFIFLLFCGYTMLVKRNATLN